MAFWKKDFDLNAAVKSFFEAQPKPKKSPAKIYAEHEAKAQKAERKPDAKISRNQNRKEYRDFRNRQETKPEPKPETKPEPAPKPKPEIKIRKSAFKKLNLSDKRKQQIKDSFSDIDYSKLKTADERQYYNGLKGQYTRLKVSPIAANRIKALAKLKGIYVRGMKTADYFKKYPGFAAFVKERANSYEVSLYLDSLQSDFEAGKVKKLVLTDGKRKYYGKRALAVINSVYEHLSLAVPSAYGLIIGGARFDFIKMHYTITVSAGLMNAALAALKNPPGLPSVRGYSDAFDFLTELADEFDSDEWQLLVSDNDKAKKELGAADWIAEIEP